MDKTRGYLDFMLLAALADGPAHGYLIIQRLRERSGGVFDYPEGSVYPALHRLEEAGLTSASWVTVSGRRRRIYGLTGKGKKALRSQATDWRRFARAVDAMVGRFA